MLVLSMHMYSATIVECINYSCNKNYVGIILVFRMLYQEVWLYVLSRDWAVSKWRPVYTTTIVASSVYLINAHTPAT